MKIFLISIWYYFIALLCWITLIILCLTIIFIPIAFALKKNTVWFNRPFLEAEWHINEAEFNINEAE
jgi:hypothetical protein